MRTKEDNDRWVRAEAVKHASQAYAAEVMYYASQATRGDMSGLRKIGDIDVVITKAKALEDYIKEG